MAFIRIVAPPFGPRVLRLACVLAAMDAYIDAPIAFEQGVFMSRPLVDRHASIDEWLQAASGEKVRGERSDQVIVACFRCAQATEHECVRPGRTSAW